MSTYQNVKDSVEDLTVLFHDYELLKHDVMPSFLCRLLRMSYGAIESQAVEHV